MLKRSSGDELCQAQSSIGVPARCALAVHAAGGAPAAEARSGVSREA
jgi:hypothetical protein